MIKNFYLENWVYLPLVLILLILILVYRKYSSHFRWQRSLQSVREQRRVNLSPLTNASLLSATIIFVFLIIGLLWAGYGVQETLIYGLGFLLIYFILEWIRRKWKGESTRMIVKLFGVSVLFIFLVMAIHYVYQTPSQELSRPTVDLYFSLSNDSYAGAPVNDSSSDDLTVVRVQLNYLGTNYDLGTYSDKTRRDQSYQDENWEKYFKGTNDGWAHYLVDLTPYLSGAILGEQLQIKFLFDDGQDCSSIKDVSVLLNKIKGIYPINYDLNKIYVSCQSDKDNEKWEDFSFELK